MIQRVQSICLLLSSIFYFLYWFFGYKWYEKGYVFFQQQLVANIDANVFQLIFDLTSLMPLVISLITFCSIFLYNRRLVQIKLANMSFYLSLLMLAYTMLYFSITLFYLLNLIDSIVTEILLYAAVFNPFICSYLIYFAIKKITHDENLINSINRIR